MKSIAVINDGIKILPFSLKAMASVYELTTEKEGDTYVNHLKDTGKVYRMDELIKIQDAHYTADYPIDPEDEYLEQYRIQELICGEICEVLDYALYKIRMHVRPNICGKMADFESNYLNNSLDTTPAILMNKPGSEVFAEFVEIAGPDEKKLEFGYRQFGFALSLEEKLTFLDNWTHEFSTWCYFEVFVRLFDVQIGLRRALRYAWYFMHYRTGNKKWYGKDLYCNQKEDLSYFRILTAYVDRDYLEEFLGQCLLFAAQHRLILFAEFLMDQKANIEYIDCEYRSVSGLGGPMTDLTMMSYLEYYRKNGKKKDIDTSVYFNGYGDLTTYAPVYGDSNKTDLEEIL